jgi:hypothetical protein
MTKPDGDRVRSYLAAVRGSYLDAFKRAVEDAKVEAQKSSRKLIIEAAASVESAAGASDDGALPYRLDVVHLGAGGAVQPTVVGPGHDLPWEPEAAQFGDFLAEIEPFVWHTCVVVGEPAPEADKWTQLRDWFLRWFQREGHSGEKPFGGVVHFMSEPQVDGDALRVQVDLGSAPVDALVDLLEVFGKMGARDGLVFTPDA